MIHDDLDEAANEPLTSTLGIARCWVPDMDYRRIGEHLPF
jgi:hypothetical protein